MYTSPTGHFPPCTRTPQSIAALEGDIIGADLEWDIRTESPTILGVSDGTRHISVPFDAGINFLREYHEKHPRAIWIGHNFLQADLPLLHKHGINVDPRNVEDTILHHWLCNMNLCKGTKGDDEEGDKRGRGFMNMWTMLSIYTDFPNHKDCREGECTGPCPEHDPFWYNAMDSYEPMVALPKMMQQEKLRGIDHLYPLHRDLMWVLGKWSREGVLINREYVRKLQDDFRADKNVLFCKRKAPRGDRQFTGLLQFNPNSSQQVIQYFKRFGITCENTQEETIRELVAEHPENEQLRHLLDYKELGDGVDRWYADRVWNESKGRWDGFVDAEGYIHSHFGPYTSSGRLQSAGPNLQNVAKRRVDRKTKESIGKRVRRAIIAPDGHLLYRADFKNAENHTYLYLAGYRDIPEEDFHSWMAKVMELKPDDEFVMSIGGGSVREAAKTIVHACLTPDHEFLSPTGWKRIDQWNPSMSVAQWSPDGSLKFVFPSRRAVFDFDGEMNLVEGTAFDQCVTPGHTFPVETNGSWREKKYQYIRKIPIESLPSHGRIPIAGVLTNIMPDLLRNKPLPDYEILQSVAVQADSHLVGHRAVFHLVKKRKIKRLKELFPDCVVKPCKCHHNGKRISVPFSSCLLDSQKRFTVNLLLMTEKQRELFLDEILLWDGNQSKDERNAKCYFNTDINSMSWVQTIAHLSGREALLRECTVKTGFGSERKQYRLSFNRRKYAGINRLKITKQHYCGKVYCFTVPSGYFLVRRNNHISVTGNTDYLEGIKLVRREELNRPRIMKEIAAGARVVFEDWKVFDMIVTFTGINLAERAFGSATLENRKRGLDGQMIYFRRFPKILDLYKRICAQVEKEGAVIPPHGYYSNSYGYPEDRLKQAASIYGSQPVAHFMKIACVRADHHPRLLPRSTIHDELIYYADCCYDPRDVRKWIEECMVFETPEMPGFRMRADISYSRVDKGREVPQSNWADLIDIK